MILEESMQEKVLLGWLLVEKYSVAWLRFPFSTVKLTGVVFGGT
jgi:hypothetical protein